MYDEHCVEIPDFSKEEREKTYLITIIKISDTKL